MAAGNGPRAAGVAGATAGAGAPSAAGSSGGGAGSGTALPGMNGTTAGRGATPVTQPPAAGAAAGSGASGSGGQPAPTAAGAGGGQAGNMAMGASGAGGATGAADPAGLPPGATNFTAVCAGGTVGMDSDQVDEIRGLDVGREFAGVKMLVRTPNQVLSFKSTLVVPETPTARQTLFIWPGLQSRDGASDPGRVGNGVLQPVLTWGSSCAPERPQDPYEGWWMSGMYVNVTTGAAGPTGCAGGDYLSTSLGDWLEIDMFLKDDQWVQTIKNVQMNKTVEFTIDLEGQVQNETMWIVEVPSGSSVRPAEDTVFVQNVMTFAQPVTSCQPDRKGSTDYFSAPTLSTDGLHCCWDKIILKAER